MGYRFLQGKDFWNTVTVAKRAEATIYTRQEWLDWAPDLRYFYDGKNYMEDVDFEPLTDRTITLRVTLKKEAQDG